MSKEIKFWKIIFLRFRRLWNCPEVTCLMFFYVLLLIFMNKAYCWEFKILWINSWKIFFVLDVKNKCTSKFSNEFYHLLYTSRFVIYFIVYSMRQIIRSHVIMSSVALFGSFPYDNLFSYYQISKLKIWDTQIMCYLNLEIIKLFCRIY